MNFTANILELQRVKVKTAADTSLNSRSKEDVLDFEGLNSQ
jgi:hypothetical protein